MFLSPVNTSHQSKKAVRGFSLVEVVMALGICSFAMIAIVGMIPVGLATFQDAMNTSVQSRIVQSLASEVLSADFRALTDPSEDPREYYYNEQGFAAEKDKPDAIYVARIELVKFSGPAEYRDANQSSLQDDDAVTALVKITCKTNPQHNYSHPIVLANNSQVR